MYQGTSATQWLAFLLYLHYETCYGVAEDLPISAYGSIFYLTIPEVEARLQPRHMVCFSTSRPTSITLTSHILRPTLKKDDYKINIRQNRTVIYNVMQFTKAKAGVPITDILFSVTSDFPIGITLFFSVPGWQMASFQALPVSFWGFEYICVGLRNSHKLHVINIEEGNEVTVVCKDDDIVKTISDLKSLDVRTVSCKANTSLETKIYKAIIAQGKKPFGLLISYSSYSTQYTCPKGFLALDMPTSTRALGKEFFILGSPSFLWRCEVVVMTTQKSTVVTLSRKGMDDQAFLIKKALTLYILPTKSIARKLTSSLPVQATLFLRSPCNGDYDTVGEISLTNLMPTVLFYNEYAFGVPHTKDTVSHMIMFIHISGVATLIYNNEPVVSANWTRIVGALNWLAGQTMVLPELNRISSHVRFGCYVYSLSTSLGYIHAAGFNGFEQCKGETNSSCVGNRDDNSIKSAAFPKRKISSYGNDFMFVVGQGSQPNTTYFYQVYMLIFTTSSVNIQVQITTKYGKKYESDSTVLTVKPKHPSILNLSQYSEGVREGVEFKDMVFKLSGSDSFSLSVVIETQNKTMAAFVALPLEHWDKEYICFGISANPVIIAINLYFENTIDVHCSNTKVTDRVSEMRPLQVQYITFCSDMTFKNVSGVSLVGISEFGVIVLETTELRNDSCSVNGTFMGQDMTMPVEAFGKDFVTINGHDRNQHGSLEVVSIFDLTEVTLYKGDNQQNELFEIRHKFEAVQIVSVQGGRRLTSNKPVQVMFVLRPSCNAQSMADVSYTLLLPDHLHYNEYYIGNPNLDGVKSRLTVVIHNSGIYSLKTDSAELSSALDWEIVTGKPSWRLGHGALPLQTASHVTSDVFFTCYVHSYKDKAASLQVAGYKSCLSLSVALRPDECYIYSIQPEPAFADTGESVQARLWLTSTFMLIYFSCT